MGDFKTEAIKAIAEAIAAERQRNAAKVRALGCCCSGNSDRQCHGAPTRTQKHAGCCPVAIADMIEAG